MNEANKLDMKEMVLNFYDHPGVSNVSNYLNIRAGAGESEKIIGKLPSYAGCEILEDANGWYKISSGGITGYVKSEYILTGDAAKEAAMSHAAVSYTHLYGDLIYPRYCGFCHNGNSGCFRLHDADDLRLLLRDHQYDQDIP